MIWQHTKSLVWLWLILMSSMVAGRAASTSITLRWNASTAGDIAGYRVYQGVSSQHYTNSVDVGNATTITFAGLTPGLTYFFAVTAYTAEGLESPFSDEISYTPGLPVRPQLRLALNAARHVVLTGNGPEGYQYAVETTQNFVTWTVIGNVTMDATAVFQFVDGTALISAVRAYRLRQTSP